MPAGATTIFPKGRKSKEGEAGDVGEYVMDLTPLGSVQIEVNIIVPGDEAMMAIRSKKSASTQEESAGQDWREKQIARGNEDEKTKD
nr:hypothetical protein BaRGS_010845 [Batillaria attramentaria]